MDLRRFSSPQDVILQIPETPTTSSTTFDLPMNYNIHSQPLSAYPILDNNKKSFQTIKSDFDKIDEICTNNELSPTPFDNIITDESRIVFQSGNKPLELEDDLENIEAQAEVILTPINVISHTDDNFVHTKIL